MTCSLFCVLLFMGGAWLGYAAGWGAHQRAVARFIRRQVDVDALRRSFDGDRDLPVFLRNQAD